MAKKENNKNSFRDMMLIIFVVLICFGITIFGIAHLTKVMVSGPETPEVPETASNEVITDPNQGDIISFTPANEQGSEIAPDNTSGGNSIQAIITPGQAAPQINQAPLPPIISIPDKQAQNNQVQQNTAAEPAQTKFEQPKQETVKQEPKQAPAVKETSKPAPVKPAPPKKQGNYVVQLVAVQSKEAADRELAKYRKKYPDVFVKRVVINGQTWYRIRMGVSETQGEAQTIADKAAAEFNIQPKVTKNK